MNKQLLELRKKFKGQTAKVDGVGFDNTPLPEGKYTAKVTKSEIKTITRKDKVTQADYDVTIHSMMVRIEVGGHKGRNLFPFAPDLNQPDGKGIESCATNIRAILGDVVPGKMNLDGQFELKMDVFLDEVEELAIKCEGELIEIQIKNQKPKADGKHLDKEGRPRQNIYILRGLGNDGKAVTHTKEQQRIVEQIDPNAGLNVSRRKKVK